MEKNQKDLSKNILIVDGYSSASEYSYFAKKRGYDSYHLRTLDPKELSKKSDLIQGLFKAEQIKQGNYKKTFNLSDFVDFATMVKELKKYNFKAVLPGGDEGIIIAEKLAFEFGLLHNKQETLIARRDKYEMQKALKKAGLRYIPYINSNNLNEILEWFRKGKFEKIVLKPRLATGSFGVQVCSTEKEIEKAFKNLIQHTDLFDNKNNTVLVEKFIEGREISINCASRGVGKHSLSKIEAYNMRIKNKTYPVYDCIFLIKKLTKPYLEAIDYVFKALDALGIVVGASHSEVFLTKDGPYLCETAARLSGSASPSSCLISTIGFSEQDESLDSYLNEKAHEENIKKAWSPKNFFFRKYFISNREANLIDIPAIELLKHIKSVCYTNFENAKHIYKTVDLFTSPGTCRLLSDNIKEIIQTYRTLRFLEEKVDKLLWTREGDAPLTPFEHSIKNKIESGESLENELQEFEKENGYDQIPIPEMLD